MTEEISLRAKIIYVVLTALFVVFLWLGDEGKQPMIYHGTDLQHTVGLIDSEDALVLQESVARNGVVAHTPAYVMNKGSYTVNLNYFSEAQGNVLELWEQGDKIAAWPIDSSENEISAEFTLSKDTKQLQVSVNYGGKGELTVKKLSVAPKTLFYTDTYLMIAVVLLLHLAGWWYIKGGRDRIPKGMILDGCVILGVTLLATTPMMQTYLYNADDLCYHLARLEGLKDGILDGQIPVNILPEGLRDNGYMNAMYPYLFLYIGAFLRLCRVSLAFSYKVLIFLSNLASACCIYVAVKSVVKSRRSVLLAVVLYTLMPYRFTNILSRGDLGETLALIFWPLVIAGLYHLIMGDKKKWYYLVIGFSGILQSHILSAAYAAAICALTALIYCVRLAKDKRYIELLKAAGLTALLNAWYAAPFLYYYFMENLDKEVLRWSGYFEQSINLSNMTQSISLYNKQYFSLGLALLGGVGIAVIYFLCERQKKLGDTEGFLLYLLILGSALVFMSTGYFPSRALMASPFFSNIATMLQFPWRFLGPASACFTFVGAAALERSQLIKHYRNGLFAMLVGLNLLVIVTVPADNNHVPYKNAEAVASKGHETKLITSVGLFYPHEWRLIDAVDEKLTRSVLISDINDISIHDYKKEGTKAFVSYTAISDKAYLELPMQNYLGYRASDELGNPLEIMQGDGGRMRFLAKGDGVEHEIHVRYGPVPGFVIANVVSAFTVFACLYLYLRRTFHINLPFTTEDRTDGDSLSGDEREKTLET